MFKQLAMNSNTYSGYSLEDAVKGARDAGFTQIELAAVEHTPHVLPNMTNNDLSQIKKLLHNNGMTCIGIGAHSNIMNEDGIENLIKCIDLATYFDCSYIITATGEAHNDSDVIDDEKVLINNLEPVLRKCNKVGKTLALETHGNNFSTGASLKKLTNQLNNEVKINYDTANVIFYGNVLPYEDLERCLEQVAFIHLKDKLGANNEWNFPAIGDGNLDYDRIFSILKKGNYNGPISVEIEFTPGGPESLHEVNEFVKRSFDYLQSLLD